MISMSKRRLGTNKEHASCMDGYLQRASGEVSHPNLLTDLKQEPAVLCSEERRLHTRNIRNIYNLFIFPSDYGNDPSFMFRAREV